MRVKHYSASITSVHSRSSGPGFTHAVAHAGPSIAHRPTLTRLPSPAQSSPKQGTTTKSSPAELIPGMVDPYPDSMALLVALTEVNTGKGSVPGITGADELSTGRGSSAPDSHSGEEFTSIRNARLESRARTDFPGAGESHTTLRRGRNTAADGFHRWRATSSTAAHAPSEPWPRRPRRRSRICLPRLEATARQRSFEARCRRGCSPTTNRLASQRSEVSRPPFLHARPAIVESRRICAEVMG